MTDTIFRTLFTEALADADRDAYVSDWALSSIWPEDSDPIENAKACARVWDLAHLTIRDIRRHTGLSQVAFAQRYLIPRRSIEAWETRYRDCPPYVRLMLAKVVRHPLADVWKI